MGKRSPDPISTTTYHHHRTSLDPSPSPTSVLERDPRSPKGWRNRDSCGIGLGIVAALNKSTGLDQQQQQQQQKLVVGFHRVSSPPLPICSPTTARKRGCPDGCNAAADGSSDPGLICASPPCCAVGSHAFPVVGFLKFCYLCRKNLDGKDIYMYRGEKAFCSPECRYRQMVADEYQESCGYEAVRPPSVVDVPSSVYGGGRLFYTGIMAA